MANLTKAELEQARAELARVNEAHGFKRNERGPDHQQAEKSPELPASASSTPTGEVGGTTLGPTPADPGPPRFLGIDLENKLAGLSGGGVIAVSDAASAKIIDILLRELRRSLAGTLAAVAATHKRPADKDQIEIPFGKPD